MKFSVLGGLILVGFSGAFGQEIPRGVASWKSELGNERVRIVVGAKADAVRVHILWRRRDANPEKKSLILIDAATGKLVKNVAAVHINREYGDVVFQPDSGPGEYELYYMPFLTTGSPYFPTVTYPSAVSRSDPAWSKQAGISDDQWEGLPEAGAIQIQSRGEFHRSDPMEVIATESDTARLQSLHTKSPF